MTRFYFSLIVFLFSSVAFAQDAPSPTGDLVKAKSAFSETWVHPEADFTQYDKLYLWEAQFEYRDVGPARKTRSTMMSTRNREFGISDAGRLKFEEVVAEAFIKEIQKAKKFEIVDEVGPDTLIMRGAVLDIISRVPPETVGRSEIYLSTIGEATLVLELMDSETGEVVAVVAERRHIQPMGGGGGISAFSMPTSNVSVIGDVRRWSSQAASKLRRELDKAIAAR